MSSSLALVVLAEHWKNLEVSYPYVYLQVKKHVKICSFYVFTFYFAACRRKKILSFPDESEA